MMKRSWNRPRRMMSILLAAALSLTSVAPGFAEDTGTEYVTEAVLAAESVDAAAEEAAAAAEAESIAAAESESTAASEAESTAVAESESTAASEAESTAAASEAAAANDAADAAAENAGDAQSDAAGTADDASDKAGDEADAASGTAGEAAADASSETADEGSADASSETAGEAGSETVSEAAGEGSPETASEAASESAGEVLTEAAGENTAESGSEAQREAVAEDGSEAQSEAAAEGSSEAQSEAAAEDGSEAESEAASEGGSEAESEAVSEAATEVITEAATEAAAETVTEVQTEAGVEEEGEAISEEATEEVTEEAIEAATEELTETLSEEASEEAPETETETETEEETEAETETEEALTAVTVTVTYTDQYGDPVDERLDEARYTGIELPAFDEDGILDLVRTDDYAPVDDFAIETGVLKAYTFSYLRALCGKSVIRALRRTPVETAAAGADGNGDGTGSAAAQGSGDDSTAAQNTGSAAAQNDGTGSAAGAAGYAYSYTTDGETWTDLTEDTVLTFKFTDGRKSVYTYEDENVTVTATLQHRNAIPDDAELVVNQMLPGGAYNYDAYMGALNAMADELLPDQAEAEAQQAAAGTGLRIETDGAAGEANDGTEAKAFNETNTLLYDVAFMSSKIAEDGTVLTGEMAEFEPAEGSVRVQIQFKNAQLSNLSEAAGSEAGSGTATGANNGASTGAGTGSSAGAGTGASAGESTGESIAVVHLPVSETVLSDAGSTLEASAAITADDITVETVEASVGTEEVSFDLTSFSGLAIYDQNGTEKGTVEITEFGSLSVGDIVGDSLVYGITANTWNFNGGDAETSMAVGTLNNNSGAQNGANASKSDDSDIQYWMIGELTGNDLAAKGYNLDITSTTEVQSGSPQVTTKNVKADWHISDESTIKSTVSAMVNAAQARATDYAGQDSFNDDYSAVEGLTGSLNNKITLDFTGLSSSATFWHRPDEVDYQQERGRIDDNTGGPVEE